MLDMGWNGNRSSVMYSFVKRAQSCHSPPVLQGLPVNTVRGTRNTTFLTAVILVTNRAARFCTVFEPVYLVKSIRQHCYTRGSV